MRGKVNKGKINMNLYFIYPVRLREGKSIKNLSRNPFGVTVSIILFRENSSSFSLPTGQHTLFIISFL